MSNDEEGSARGGRRGSRVLLVSVALLALFGSAVWKLTGGAADEPAGGTPGPVEQSALRPAGGGPGAGPELLSGPGERTRYDRLAGVDWRRLRYPMRCGPAGVRVVATEFADVTRDREPEATVLVRCAGDAKAPAGLFVYAAGKPGGAGAPRLYATLLRPGDGVIAARLKVSAVGIKVSGFRYSSPAVARCCPDETIEACWRWTGSGFTRLG